MVGENLETLVAALNDQLTQCLAERNVAVLNDLLDETIVMVPPRVGLIKTKAGVIGFWKRARQIQSVSLVAESVLPLGDGTIGSAGSIEISVNDQTGQAKRLRGSFYSIWGKADGTWTLRALIWNRRGPGQNKQRQNSGAGDRRLNRNRNLGQNVPFVSRINASE